MPVPRSADAVVAITCVAFLATELRGKCRWQPLLSALVVAIAKANSGDINVLFVGLLVAGASFCTSPVATAAFVLGLMLIPRATVARDRILAVSSIVLGGLGALSPTILYVWSFIASQKH